MSSIFKVKVISCQTCLKAGTVWWYSPWSGQCCFMQSPACSCAKLHCRCVSKRLGIGENWNGEAWAGKARDSSRGRVVHIEESRLCLNVSYLSVSKRISMLLGAFWKSQKATIIFVMFVRASVRRFWTTRLSLEKIPGNLHLISLRKSVEINQDWIKYSRFQRQHAYWEYGLESRRRYG